SHRQYSSPPDRAMTGGFTDIVGGAGVSPARPDRVSPTAALATPPTVEQSLKARGSFSRGVGRAAAGGAHRSSSRGWDENATGADAADACPMWMMQAFPIEDASFGLAPALRTRFLLRLPEWR